MTVLGPSPSSATLLARPSPNTGADLLAIVTQELDLARNQFRARNIAEAYASTDVAIHKLQNLLLSDKARLSERDIARAKCLEACALTLKGRCAEEQRDPDEAHALWQRAVRLFTENRAAANPTPDMLGYYGAALRMTGDRPGAIAVFKEVLAKGGAVPETFRHYGLALKDEGRFAEAAEQLRKAVELASSDLRSWRGLAEALEGLGGEANRTAAADAYLSLTAALRDAGDYQAALLAVENSLRLDSDARAGLLIRGELLRLTGRLDEAITVLDHYLGGSPNDPIALATKGAVLNAQGENVDAQRFLDRAIELNPTYAWAIAMKGTVLSDQEQYESAIGSYRNALKIDPSLWGAAAELSRLLVIVERPNEALAAANQTLELKPGDPFSLSMRGVALMQMNRLAEALEAFDQAIEMQSDYEFAWSHKGSVLLQMERDEEALAALERARELNPDDGWALSRLGELLARSKDPAHQERAGTLLLKVLDLTPDVQVLTSVAIALESLGRLDESVAAADKAIQLDRSFAGAYQIKAEALRRLGHNNDALAAINTALTLRSDSAFALGTKGQILCALDRNSEAELVLRAAIDIDREIPWIWETLGQVFCELSRPEEALPALEEALRLRPQDASVLGLKARALVGIGDNLQAKGDNATALRRLDEAISIAPEDAAAHAIRGYVCHSMRRLADAEAALRRSIELDRNIAWTHAELAAVLRELEQPQQALAAVDEALRLKDDYASAMEIKARILIQIGENARAEPICARAIELDSSVASAHFWRGQALDNLGRLEEARGAYEEAHSRSREDVWTRIRLADILLLLNQREAAIKHFEWILSMASTQEHTTEQLSLCGWCHYGCDRLDPAIRLYSEAVAIDEERVVRSSLFDLALVIGCSKRYSLAKREYMRAIEVALKAHAWLRKGIFWSALNDLNRALNFRHPHLAKSPDITECVQRMRKEYQSAPEYKSWPA
jgi:tetratricopeptide (TPR) repeat protein